MSNPYKPITAYLQSKGIGTEGINLFIAHVPQSPDTCLTIIPTPGIYDPNNIQQPYSKGTFQLFARGNDFTAAYALLDSAYNELQNLVGATLSDMYFVEIVALQETPTFVGKDSMNRFQLVQNYRFEVWKQTEYRQ